MKTRLFLAMNLVFVWMASAAMAAPSLTVGSLSGAAGKTISLPIAFDPSAAKIASMQFNLTLPKGLSLRKLDPGAVLTAAGKNVKSHLQGRTLEVLIFGMNENTISTGNLLTANLKIASTASAGSLAVPISGIVYTDAKGKVVTPGPATNGAVTVAGSN